MKASNQSDLSFDATALFRHSRDNLSDDLSQEIEWEFTFACNEATRLERATDELSDIIKRVLRREPHGLAAELDTTAVIVERGKNKPVGPLLLIAFTDVLTERQLQRLHERFAAAAASIGIDYRGVGLWQAFDAEGCETASTKGLRVGDSNDTTATSQKAKSLPAHFEHSKLGRFSLDRRSNDYKKSLRVGREKIDLVLNCGHEDADRIATCPTACAKIALTFFSNLPRFVRKARDFAGRKLLRTRNTSWLDEGELPISHSEFIARIKASQITVDRNGGAMWFEDDDLFGGHIIIVSFGRRGGFRDASIAG